MSRFQGKTVVITGASRGIGAALAKRFAREGGAVVVSANEPACETVAADIVKTGGKAIAFVADVTRKADAIALYDAAEQAFGGVTSRSRTPASSPSRASKRWRRTNGTK